MKTVHVIVPASIDDPARPSGGNTYDRRVCDGLAGGGWAVREHLVPEARHDALAQVVRRIPDDALVLCDGLLASAAPETLVPAASRLRLVVLVHMPFGHRPADAGARDREHAVLAAAAAVIVTSDWTRRRLLALYGVCARVARPGVDAAALAPGTAGGTALLCVAAVTPGKGHALLLDALATATDLPFTCACVGSLDKDAACAERVRRRAGDLGLGDRVSFPGPATGAQLDAAYAAADLVVLVSEAETYGMVVTEALARGLPVVATDVGGVTEALGYGDEATRPGVLVPPGERAALGAALRGWLVDAPLRERLRRAAWQRREALPAWSATTAAVAGVLEDAGVLEAAVR